MTLYAKWTKVENSDSGAETPNTGDGIPCFAWWILLLLLIVVAVWVLAKRFPPKKGKYGK